MPFTKRTVVYLSTAALLALALAGCPQPAPTGDTAAGEALFNARCIGCHPNPADVSATAVVNDLGTINPAMTGVTLTDQEAADVKAYLSSLAPPATGDAAAGQALFSSRCIGCHPNPAGVSGSAVINDLGTINVLMIGVTLTDQEVLDVKAYLATQ
jgi:mono/diheme cytochrome c family protein